MIVKPRGYILTKTRWPCGDSQAFCWPTSRGWHCTCTMAVEIHQTLVPGNHGCELCVLLRLEYTSNKKYLSALRVNAWSGSASGWCPVVRDCFHGPVCIFLLKGLWQSNTFRSCAVYFPGIEIICCFGGRGNGTEDKTNDEVAYPAIILFASSFKDVLFSPYLGKKDRGFSRFQVLTWIQIKCSIFVSTLLRRLDLLTFNSALLMGLSLLNQQL